MATSYEIASARIAADTLANLIPQLSTLEVFEILAALHGEANRRHDSALLMLQELDRRTLPAIVASAAVPLPIVTSSR
jgi:hypothetical protein